MKNISRIFPTNELSVLDKFSYGVGNLGFGVIMQCIASFLLFYSTVILGVPGKYIGVILSVSVFWDAITDPVVGYLSDITNLKRYGRRHLYLLVGTLSVAIVNYFLWNIDVEYSQGMKIILLLIGIFVIKTCMTIYGTPYTALGAELSQDYDTRTSIQGYRVFFFLVGLAFPTVIGVPIFFRTTELFPVGQHNPSGYSQMGLSISIIMILSGLMCYGITKKFIPYLPKGSGQEREPFRFKAILETFTGSLKNKDFSKVFWGYLLVNISAALIGSLGLHVFTYTFNMDSRKIAVTMGVFFTSTLISQPYWTRHSFTKDKQPCMQQSILISIVGCSLFTVLVFLKDFVSVYYWVLTPALAIIGFGAGGLFLFPPAMVGDVIDVEECETGRRSEGVYFGTMTFGYKASQAIAIFLVGLSLDIVGFNSNAEVQSSFTVLMIGLILCVGSMIVLIAAFQVYKKYTLNKNKILSIQNKIQREEQLN